MLWNCCGPRSGGSISILKEGSISVSSDPTLVGLVRSASRAGDAAAAAAAVAAEEDPLPLPRTVTCNISSLVIPTDSRVAALSASTVPEKFRTCDSDEIERSAAMQAFKVSTVISLVAWRLMTTVSVATVRLNAIVIGDGGEI